MMSARMRRDSGMTLLESTVSVSLITAIVAIFTMSVNDAMESGTSIAGAAGAREQGRRALTRMKRELAMIGRNDDTTLGITLPQVFDSGWGPAPLDGFGFEHDTQEIDDHLTSLDPQLLPLPAAGGVPAVFVAPRLELGPSAVREIVFRSPTDLDGDGSVFEQATGGLEWSTDLVGFLMTPDGRGGFNLVRRSSNDAGNFEDEVLMRGVEGLTFDIQESRPTLPLQAIEIHLHILDHDRRGRPLRHHLSTTVMMRNSP